MAPAAATLAFRVLCQRACGAAGTSHHAQRNQSEQVVGTRSHTQPIRVPDEALGMATWAPPREHGLQSLSSVPLVLAHDQITAAIHSDHVVKFAKEVSVVGACCRIRLYGVFQAHRLRRAEVVT